MSFKHLQENNISYFNHFKQSMWIAFRLTICVPKAMLHAIWPSIYEKDASDECEKILRRVYPKIIIIKNKKH